MRPIDTSTALAHEHDLDVRRAARSARLAALATCCDPSAWARGLRRTASSVTHLLRPTTSGCTCT
jgi:hypothetical protein